MHLDRMFHDPAVTETPSHPVLLEELPDIDRPFQDPRQLLHDRLLLYMGESASRPRVGDGETIEDNAVEPREDPGLQDRDIMGRQETADVTDQPLLVTRYHGYDRVHPGMNDIQHAGARLAGRSQVPIEEKPVGRHCLDADITSVLGGHRVEETERLPALFRFHLRGFETFTHRRRPQVPPLQHPFDIARKIGQQPALPGGQHGGIDRRHIHDRQQRQQVEALLRTDEPGEATQEDHLTDIASLGSDIEQKVVPHQEDGQIELLALKPQPRSGPSHITRAPLGVIPGRGPLPGIVEEDNQPEDRRLPPGGIPFPQGQPGHRRGDPALHPAGGVVHRTGRHLLQHDRQRVEHPE